MANFAEDEFQATNQKYAEDEFAPPPPAGTFGDTVFSYIKPFSDVLKAFGQSAKDGWGAVSFDLDKDQKSNLSHYGYSQEEYNKTHSDLAKAYNQAFVRPVLWDYEKILKAGSAILGGLGGMGQEFGRQMIEQAKEYQKLGLPISAAVTGEIGDILGAGASGQYFGEPGVGIPGKKAGEFGVHPLGIEELGQELAKKAVTAEDIQKRFRPLGPNDLFRARAAGQIGEGEPGFFNTRKPSEENLKARAEAAQAVGEELPTIEPPETDIHKIARQVDPYTFKLHDYLREVQANARESLERLRGQRGANTEKDILQLLSTVGGDESELSEPLAKRLQNLRDKLEYEKQVYSPLEQKTQKIIMDAEFKLRDLQPDIASAYEHARSILPDIQEEYEQNWMKYAEEVSRKELSKVPSETAPEKPKEPRLGTSQEPPQPQGATEGAPVSAIPGEGVLKPVEGTGATKTRGLAQTINAKAIEDDLTEGFSDLPTYKQVSMRDQAQRVSELIANAYESAKQMAMGLKRPPEGVLPESVMVGVRKQAIADKDIDLIRKLASESKLLEEGTTMGQRIRTLGEIDPNDPVSVIASVEKAREGWKKYRDPEYLKREIQTIKDSIKKNAISPEATQNFIKTIECDY